jgi:hypothetical protein
MTDTRSHRDPPFYDTLITQSNTTAACFAEHPILVSAHLVWLVFSERVGILVLKIRNSLNYYRL